MKKNSDFYGRDASVCILNMTYPWGTFTPALSVPHQDFSINPVLASTFQTADNNLELVDTGGSGPGDGYLSSTMRQSTADMEWRVGTIQGSKYWTTACCGEIPRLLLNYEIGDIGCGDIEDAFMWIDISYTDLSSGISYSFEKAFSTGYNLNAADLSGRYGEGNYMRYNEVNAAISPWDYDLLKYEPRFSRSMSLYVHGSTYDICENCIPEDQPGGITGYKPYINSSGHKSSAVQFNQGVFALHPLCMSPKYKNLGFESSDPNNQIYRLCDNSNYQLRLGISNEENKVGYSNWVNPFTSTRS